MNTYWKVWGLFFVVGLLGCAPAAAPPAVKQSSNKPADASNGAAPEPAKPTTPVTITLATTFSPRDSGLLDVLTPLFRDKTGIELKVVAVGSGQAIEIARRGDADVSMTHSPAAEEKFMAEGHGAFRHPLMYNDFVLIGPADDPAKISGTESIAAAFAALAKRQGKFVSRGDESGTHIKERDIWKKAGLEPAGDWYIAAGAGMTQTLRMADELGAYTLTDRGTYLSAADKARNSIACEGDPLLVNPYSVMVVNADKHPGVQQAAAQQFADFLLSPDGQAAIASFGLDKFGQALFNTYDMESAEADPARRGEAVPTGP